MNVANSVSLRTEPIVGTLRVAGGVRREDAALWATAMAPPSQVARGRADERLFVLLDLTGPASPRLYRELREVLAQTYWSITGSITAALRQAATAVNGHLFRINLRSAPSDRCTGSLMCAVLHEDDLFILQAGSGRACFLHGEHLECFSRGEEPPPLGLGPLADVHLYHTFVAPGDTLLLASSALVREAGKARLARALFRADVQAVQEGLEQIGAGADLTALVVRWALPGEAPAVRGVPVVREAPRPPPRRERRPPQVERRAPPKPARRPGPSLGEWMGKGIRSGGRGIAAAAVWLAGGVSTLFRRMLPGPDRRTRRRAQVPRPRPVRPAPRENRIVMMAIAIGIPVVLAIVVVLAYLSFGAESRARGFINQAKEEEALAQAAGSSLEEARRHWEAALEHASSAIALRPDDPAAAALQAQIRAALDRLDSIVRLRPVLLWDFGPGTVPRQLVIHGQMAFILDPAGGWVARLTLNPSGDGVVERESASIVVQTGQQIGEGRVGDLAGCAWVSPGGERQTSGLLILEKDGALVNYDPAWVDEGGVPKLARSFLGTSPTLSKAVGSFGGRLYILDADVNQIWRYDPRGDIYPEQPDRYFATPPPRSLAEALSMAIDGKIYVLYQDGGILQFLQGQYQPAFVVRGLPDGIGQAVALAVDPAGGSGVVYLADRGNKRVVVLGADGAFQVQFRADEAFDALETLAVDEAARRLYVISGGQLYVASLP